MIIVFIDQTKSGEIKNLCSNLCVLGHEVRLVVNLELIIYKQKIVKEKDFTVTVLPIISGKNLLPFSFFFSFLFPFFILFYIPLKLRIGDIYFYEGGGLMGMMMRFVQMLLHKPVTSFNKEPKDIKDFEKKCYLFYQEYFKKR